MRQQRPDPVAQALKIGGFVAAAGGVLGLFLIVGTCSVLESAAVLLGPFEGAFVDRLEGGCLQAGVLTLIISGLGFLAFFAGRGASGTGTGR